MKAIILLAGLGTRLRPHTYSKPKPLVQVAGKPVLGHVMDSLDGLQIEETIFIVGYLGEQIEKYIADHYPQMRARYVEQDEMKGQAHAIRLAKDYIDQDVLIIFGDTIWETDFTRLKHVKGDGLIYTKEVTDPRRFGVALLKDGFVTKFVEKPSTPVSNLAVVGVYYFRAWRRLLQSLDALIDRNIQTKGEYFLADAMQLMIEDGARLEAETIPVWEDCGTVPAILQTNRYLLTKHGSHARDIEGTVVMPPVYISDSARIVNSIIGPNVSISEDATVANSIVRDCIISENAHIENAMLESSLIGNGALVRGTFQRLNVGDSSEIDSVGNVNGH
ncbi:MAG: NTP transferase domain-containing protein [Chloroflexota bacterium]|nr:NTP transferase domain-containing protein [Chloroflexota bacterium]